MSHLNGDFLKKKNTFACVVVGPFKKKKKKTKAHENLHYICNLHKLGRHGGLCFCFVFGPTASILTIRFSDWLFASS